MKRSILAAALFGLAGCAGDPATAVIDGLEASYSKDGRPDAIVVSLAENGDARLYAGKRRGIVRRDGLDYLMNEKRVAIDGTKFRMEPIAALRSDVVGMEDLAEAARRRRAAELDATPGVREVRLPDGRVFRFAPPPVLQFKVEQIGTEEVAGRRGQVWRLSAIGDGRPNGLEAVTTTDKALAPVGRLVALHLAAPEIAELQQEGTPRNFARALADLLGTGALLRLSVRGDAGQTQELFRLMRFGPGSFRGSVLELPKTVLDRTTLRGDLEILAPSEEVAPMTMI
ncbi:hypothetical protein ABS767_01110 [Sphingomonas sp. ST-64]|uniref:DUF4292 domain-containing protein n=1 Tax=Sphingomonas plantiphila TaxID=3163295 RepID=A0ABW8YI35_9SPHN